MAEMIVGKHGLENIPTINSKVNDANTKFIYTHSLLKRILIIKLFSQGLVQ